MEIITGKQNQPVKSIVYGVAGIGKTTFAAKWPKPLFIDVESGSLQMDVARIIPKTFSEVRQVVANLQKDTMGYKTLVIDSADRLEEMIIQHICTEGHISTIEKYGGGYGKGWTYMVEIWGAFLDILDCLRVQKDMNILFIGHSKTKRYEPADDAGYDRYTLTMNDKSADQLKRWSDLTLFIRHDVVSQEENGRNKACGNAPRVMHSQFHPCWDAKNRYGLPAKMPFDFEKISFIFEKIPSKNTNKTLTSPVPAPAPAPAPKSAPAPAPAPADDGKQEIIEKIKALISQAGVTREDVMLQFEKRGIVPAGTPISNYNIQTLNRLVTGWDKIVYNINLAKNNA